MRFGLTVATFVAFAMVSGNSLSAQAPATLPAADVRIQKLLTEIINPQSTEEYFAAIVNAARAKDRNEFSDEAWLQQSLVALRDQGAELGSESRLALISRDFLAIDSRTFMRALAPFFEDKDAKVSQKAQEIAASAISRVPQPPFDLFGTGKLTDFSAYLKSCGNRDPSWKFVQGVFSANPDAAFLSAINVHFERDRSARLEIERMRKELMRLAVEYDLAAEGEKTSASEKLVKKLDEMAQHSHWTVRAYVLSFIDRGYLLGPFRGDHWSKDTTVPSRLSEDKNPFVASLAKSIATKIRK